MESRQGKAVAEGIARGKIVFVGKNIQIVKRKKIEDTVTEIERYEDARKKAVQQLKGIQTQAVKIVGKANAQIFEVHAMMLEDEDYNASVRKMILTQNVNAEFAVAKTGDKFIKIFQDMEDEYFQAREADVKDISERVINLLKGREDTFVIGEEPVVIVAKNLSPSEMVQLERKKILALVLEQGGVNSHMAILARSMGIPTVTGIQVLEEWNGEMSIVDGYNGMIYLNPNEETITKMDEKRKRYSGKEQPLRELIGRESVTAAGKRISLYSNVGGEEDVDAALKNDAEGIGLFRTENIYMGRKKTPSEEEQFKIYKEMAEKMRGKKMIIRTLDIGADKLVDYIPMEKEKNPALGYRGIRISLEQTEIFRTQIRAILRAASYGNISVLFPMIISVEEVLRIKEILQDVRRELEQENQPYGAVETGIMIETPAAVMMSEELAAEVDFFSIGTNDLTQYTLAADRQNKKVLNIYDDHHPAILKMIQKVIESGHKNGIWVGICGELGADITLTKTLIEMGIDELSVSPGILLKVREAILKS